MTVFTLCSNNYLAYARVLGASLKKFQPESAYCIILVDELVSGLNYDEIGFKVIPIKDIEPEIERLAVRYSIVELNTCVKARVFEYLLDNTDADQIVYLDPDIQLFAPMDEVTKGLNTADILLTPHIESPIPLDRETPAETHFLNYGIYNLGFIALSRNEEAARFLNWWKERTYSQGYSRVADGLFVDQLYVNLVPLFFSGVHILRHQGYNMGPWNLHERRLSDNGNELLVNGGSPLVFFHFSSFKLDSFELPVHHYSRYTLQNRPDLRAIYHAYNADLKTNKYATYHQISCYYTRIRDEAVATDRKRALEKMPFTKKLVYSVIDSIPGSLRKRLSNLLINR